MRDAGRDIWTKRKRKGVEHEEELEQRFIRGTRNAHDFGREGKRVVGKSNGKTPRHALEDGSESSIQPPTQQQVAEVARLTGKVEGMTNQNLTASAALGLSGQVLELAIQVTGV